MSENLVPTTEELVGFTGNLVDYCGLAYNHGFEVDEWLARLEAIRDRIDRTPEVPIALLGGTGAGKSSLLNALLGERLLATSSSEACTSAITEVAFSESSFSARVEFITRDQWETELGQLELEIADARQRSGSDEDGQTDLGVSKVAKNKLASLYGTDRADEYERTLDRSILVEPPELADAFDTGSATFSEPDMSKFGATLSLYVASEHMFWPIVKKVRVDGPFRHLQDGAVLVDLPGLNDPNAAREAATREHLKAAQFVWVVFNMKRALTRDIYEFLTEGDLLRRLYMDGRVGQISFVGTHSDGIDFDVDIERYGLGEECDTIEIVEARNSHVKKVVGEQLTELAKDIALGAGTTPDRVSALKNQLERSPVFCTSSRDFMRLTNITKRGNIVLEDVHDTNIPELAEHLNNLARTLGQSAHVDGLRHELLLVRRDIAYEVELRKTQVEAGHLGNTAQIGEVKAAATQAATFLEQRTERASAYVAESVDKAKVELTTRLDKAILDAQDNFADLPKIWRATSWNTLKATARRGGAFSGSTKRCDIPRDISKPVLDGVSVAWVDFFGITAGASIDFAANTIEDGVADYIEKFQDDVFNISEELDALIAGKAEQAFETSQELVFDRTDALRKVVNERLDKDRTELTESIEQRVSEAMAPAFEQAAQESGSGMHARMVDILEEGLRQAARVMFEDVRETVNAGLIDLRAFMTGSTDTAGEEVRTEAGKFANAVLDGTNEHLADAEYEELISALDALVALLPTELFEAGAEQPGMVVDELPQAVEESENADQNQVDELPPSGVDDGRHENDDEHAGVGAEIEQVDQDAFVEIEIEIPDEEPTFEVAPETHWFDDYVRSGKLAARASRSSGLTEDLIASAVAALDNAGGRLSIDDFARALNLSKPRARRSVASLGQVLNVDGYEVVKKDETHVHLNADLLRRQFSSDD